MILFLTLLLIYWFYIVKLKRCSQNETPCTSVPPMCSRRRRAGLAAPSVTSCGDVGKRRRLWQGGAGPLDVCGKGFDERLHGVAGGDGDAVRHPPSELNYGGPGGHGGLTALRQGVSTAEQNQEAAVELQEQDGRQPKIKFRVHFLICKLIWKLTSGISLSVAVVTVLSFYDHNCFLLIWLKTKSQRRIRTWMLMLTLTTRLTVNLYVELMAASCSIIQKHRVSEHLTQKGIFTVLLMLT